MLKSRMFAAVLTILVCDPALGLANDGITVFTVQGVAPGDKLNIRIKPKASSAVVGQMQNGEQGFVNTYNCWNSATGKKIKPSRLNPTKPNQWCSVMTGDDPVVTGFARFKYLQ